MMQVALKTLIFLLLVPGTALVLVPWLLLGRNFPWELTGSRLLALLPLSIGVPLFLRSVWGFAREGQGTPAPIDPPKSLVVKGPYRWVRNPMYVGAGLILIGEAIAFAAPRLLVYLALFWLGTHCFVVFHEEPTLGRKFGASYEAYLRAVPRWLPRRPAA